MAFPGTGSSSLATAWQQIQSTAGQIKDKCTVLNAAASITRRSALELQNFLADSLALLDTNTAKAGLLAYARNEMSNPSLDLTSEFSSMRTALVAVQDWTVTNFPKDASNNLAVYSFDGNKRFADVNLTAGQLSAFKTQINGLAATIS